MKISLAPYLLNFKFAAGTSRGILKTRKTWFLKLEDNAGRVGIGEIAPLKGLSIEGYDDFDITLQNELKILKGIDFYKFSEERKRNLSSSTLFGIECALLELQHHQGQIFINPFYTGNKLLPINGLIWMGELDFMKAQIKSKLEAGFACLKMKIGAVGFESEYKILQSLREEFSKEMLTIRVDANGAFTPEEAMKVMSKLDALSIHSIEQPIRAGQAKKMRHLCSQGFATGIALDEELIGIRNLDSKIELLKEIDPQYIILKPTLHGGLLGAEEWISVAEDLNINWWMTSALESNVGLNAICQFTASFQTNMYQGLGTGGLYTNNIESPLYLKGEYIGYNPKRNWNLADVNFQEI